MATAIEMFMNSQSSSHFFDKRIKYEGTDVDNE